MAKRKTKPAQSVARQLAVQLIKSKGTGRPGATVLLGAGASISSGIPLWTHLAERVCRECAIPCSDKPPTVALCEYFSRLDVPYEIRYTFFQRYLEGQDHSIGYSHLGQMVKDGLISTVLTTNWDSLLEAALLRFIPCAALKVLVRGEMPDDIIADVLSWRHGRPTVLKLHGDVQSRRFLLGDSETRGFDGKLSLKLSELLSDTTFVVGQSAQDVDILSLLIGCAGKRKGMLYHVRHAETPSEIDSLLERAGANVVHGEQASILADGHTVNVGDFDSFFTQLNLAVQRELIEEKRSLLRQAESSILNKEKTGVGYINYTRISDLVDHFALQVQEADPDLILYIDDPSAPGGMELRRRLLPLLKSGRGRKKFAHDTICVKGQGGSRAHKRGVTSKVSDLKMDGVRKVLVLDAITFSGNTLALAREQLKEAFPNVSVKLGVLVISQQLLASEGPAKDYLYQEVTDRHEIFFPWGVTQTTSTFDRSFEAGVDGEGRRVAIGKRPWGTIEVLADEELTSVRLLTIEAGCKLSFQRHLCRDELFVALDDNIGLDICAEDLTRKANPYDEHVKSLILEKSDYVLIPRGVWHRTKASMDRVRLLEVAFGLYDQSSDIERRWDDFEREHDDGTK